MLKYVKFEFDKAVIKIAGKKESFSDPLGVNTLDGDINLNINKLLEANPNAKVIIRFNNAAETADVAKALTPEPVLKVETKPRDLSNIETASTTDSDKYDASDIPGNMALLRNNNTKRIYIGPRKHTYSYLNVCCVTPEIAKKFLYDVAHTVSSATAKTKAGHVLRSVDSRDAGIHEYWMKFMDNAYAAGIKSKSK